MEPDPPRAEAGMPGAIGRVLRLVRRLIDYGKQIAETVQQRAAAPGFALFARPFGTADLAVILARITNGLRRAEALEAKLCQRAERGQDIKPESLRMPLLGASGAARNAARPNAPPEEQPSNNPQDPRLACLPTEAEIAADVRRRPVGAVIVDICCDLGIVPGHCDRAFWDELTHAIIRYGGSLVRFYKDVDSRLFSPGTIDYAGVERLEPFPQLTLAATGPP